MYLDSPRKKLKILKNLKFSKMVPLTPYNNPLHNHLVWSKIGCLQKKLDVKRLKFEGMVEIFAGDHIFSHFRECKKI